MSSVAGELVDAFEEVETGKLNSRPALAQALAACRATHATLIIAELDRLAGNAAFLLSGWNEVGRGWCSATCPRSRQDRSGKFVIAIMAAVAELEAGLISERTKAALAQAKARGVRLGNPRLQPGTREEALQAAAAKRRQAADRAAQVRPYIEAARKAGAAAGRGAEYARGPRGTRWRLACRERLAAAAAGVALVSTLGSWWVRAEQRVADHRPHHRAHSDRQCKHRVLPSQPSDHSIRGHYGVRHCEIASAAPGVSRRAARRGHSSTSCRWARPEPER